MDVRWRIEMLGGLRVAGTHDVGRGDRVLSRFRTQKTGALLAYLAYYPQRTHRRDQLIELLWPDCDLPAGRNNLSRELSWLRDQLEPPAPPAGNVIAADRAAIRLNPEAIATDVGAFEAALQAAECAGSPIERAQYLAEAIERYGGELLPGYFEGWILQEREWLSERYFQALGQLLAHLEQARDLPRALEYARRGIRADPLREEAHRDLMRLLAAVGQPAAALRQYRELKRLLQQELEAEPAAATQALARDIERLPDRSSEFLPSSPILEPPKTSAHPHNLPQPLTSFIGREEQMSDVEQLLAAHRLVTLTGAGGCGKTRLALQLAADLLEAYPDGVWLVELAALADPALVSQRVASVLGVQEEPGCPLVTTLTAYLRPRSLLLVLDNCEHLLAASTQLGETLLRACPNLRILATSREGLGLLGEQTYRVPSLSLPDPRSLPPLEQLQAVEAVRLFVDRALLCRPTFALTPANAASVAEVCHRLDGIPLAIELAAARAKVLPVEQVAARLDDRFRLLTGGSRTALPRQQTLRALIDWSYDLLTEPERALLRRLSVFAGGWTLEAAEAVCPGDGIEAWEVLDLLTSLVEKSLAIYEEREDEARYRLLETVRQYARDRLLEAGEEAAVQARHRDWFLALAERAEAERRGSKEMEWINRLEIEHDNMRAALAWCQAETTGVEAGLRLGSALEWFWLRRGPMTEGRQWLAQLLSQGGELSLTVRIKALTQSAGLANFQMDFPTADALAAEGLALAREANDRQLIADCLSSGVRMLFNRGRPELAAAMTEEGLALAREVGEPGPIADWLLCRAWVATNQGVAPNPCDEELALSLYMESLALFRELGDKASIARVLPYCAQHYWFSGNVDQANAMLQEALAVNRQLGDPYATVWSLAVLGHFTRQREEYVVARAHFEERLVVSRELPDKRLMVGALLDLAQVAHAQGDATKARDLLVEARPLCQELGDRNGEANACMVEGDLLLDLGDYAAARSCYEECLAMRRAAGQTWAAAWALLGVGQAVRLQGEPGVAHSHAREAHAMFQECGDKSAIAWSLSDLGRAVGDQGDLAAARQLLEESLAIFRTQGKKGGIGRVLERLAAVAVAQAEPERAARLFGSAEGLREAMGAPLPPAERAEHERSVAAVRTSLGEETFATAWAAGRAMPMEEAVSYALEKEAPQ